MKTAGLNVTVNTRLMADRAKAARLDAQVEEMLREYPARANAVYERVRARLGGK